MAKTAMEKYEHEIREVALRLHVRHAKTHALVDMLAMGFVNDNFTPLELLGVLPLAVEVANQIRVDEERTISDRRIEE